MHKTKGIASSLMASKKCVVTNCFFRQSINDVYANSCRICNDVYANSCRKCDLDFQKVSGDKKLLEDLSFQAKSGDYSFVTQIIVTLK